MTLPIPFAFPTYPTSISIADINAECGYDVNTQHGLDWVFSVTRPEERPAASGYTPVNVYFPGGTIIGVANSNIAHYEVSSVCTPPNDIFPPLGNRPLGWAYYNNDIRNSNCNNGNCPNCGTSNCGNIGGDNCSSTPINCTTPDSQAWLQNNCNCACSFNCDLVTYSHNCNCACPWICACACW